MAAVCASAANLTKSKGREIQRTECDQFIEQNQQNINNHKDLYKQRQAIVEHAYGTIKRAYTYTLLKGIEKV